MATKTAPESTKATQDLPKNHLVANFQETGIIQFPGSVSKAIMSWYEYLNNQLKEGWLLTQVLSVKIGRADQKHLVFYKTALKGTIYVVDLNSSIPSFAGTVKASQANLEGFLNSKPGLTLLATTQYTFGVETRTLAIFLEKA
jgi:hypothetical protein